ncbi:hypothetical protein QYE76_008570 [Lolium multiflorum]|uniref:Uncharacterized protein n=1 Tax=Lolium multiflorum TaxID=4521 RepID=A0AAD8TTN1_LOLMU|nr:hypothetical protein QYE76_008570 [Lolium multiflorum]
MAITNHYYFELTPEQRRNPQWHPDYSPTWDSFFINWRESALARHEEDGPPPSNFNEAGRRLWWRGRTLHSVMAYRGLRLRYPQSQPLLSRVVAPPATKGVYNPPRVAGGDTTCDDWRPTLAIAPLGCREILCAAASSAPPPRTATDHCRLVPPHLQVVTGALSFPLLSLSARSKPYRVGRRFAPPLPSSPSLDDHANGSASTPAPSSPKESMRGAANRHRHLLLPRSQRCAAPSAAIGRRRPRRSGDLWEAAPPPGGCPRRRASDTLGSTSRRGLERLLRSSPAPGHRWLTTRLTPVGPMATTEKTTDSVIEKTMAPVMEKTTAPVMEKPTAPVMARDRIPITVREWNKSKKVPESEVADRYKRSLFDDLMAHFTLLELGSQTEMDKQRELVKKWTLKKMGELFRAWKNRLWATYKDEKKPPKFEGYLSKQEHNWEEFVKYKSSEDAVALSKKNKKNASEKLYHHHTGRGGYQVSMPKWDAQEAEMQRNGITPEPIRENWDTRARNWFLGHGCEYDMKTGNLVKSGSKVKIPRENGLK